MRASEIVARLKRRIVAQDAMIAALRAQVQALGGEDDEGPPDWRAGLTHNQVALVARLLHAKGRVVSVWALADAMPSREMADDRDLGIVKVQVRKARMVLGQDAIKTVYGRGYRIGAEFYRAAKPT